MYDMVHYLPVMRLDAKNPLTNYRFWKNGKQVDPLKEKLNVSKSIPKNQMPQFEQVVQAQKAKLHNILIG